MNGPDGSHVAKGHTPGEHSRDSFVPIRMPSYSANHVRTPSRDVTNDWLDKPPTSPINQNTNFSFAIKNGMDYYHGPQAGPFVVASFAPRPIKKKGEADYIDASSGTPFEIRHGRRYLRDSSYMLPCDLPELNRQSLDTMLGNSVFESPISRPMTSLERSRKILELGCGNALWTSTCHNFMASLGHQDVSFTGVDIAPLAPNLSENGINWRFVLHDLRRYPWPFDDGEFDMVMVKDMSLAVPDSARRRFVDECQRILLQGGLLEFRETEHILSSLTRESAARQSSASSSLVQQANDWIELACKKYHMSPVPIQAISHTLKGVKSLKVVKTRRIGIPLGNMSHERRHDLQELTTDDLLPVGCRTRLMLAPEHAAARTTALVTYLQKIQSLEPQLMEASGKNDEEWASYWSSLNSSLLGGTSNEVCVMFGATVAVKSFT